jgi:hypothetical protein
MPSKYVRERELQRDIDYLRKMRNSEKKEYAEHLTVQRLPV